jgi:hypothetical protein
MLELKNKNHIMRAELNEIIRRNNQMLREDFDVLVKEERITNTEGLLTDLVDALEKENERMRTQVRNFIEQAERAGADDVKTYVMIQRYQKEFPSNIQVIQDEVQLKDVNHFIEWKLKNGYK